MNEIDIKIDFIKKVAATTAKKYLDKHGVDRSNFYNKRVKEEVVDDVLADILEDLIKLVEIGQKIQSKDKREREL